MTIYHFTLYIACAPMRYGPNCELTCKMNCLNKTCDSKSGYCPVTEPGAHVCTQILSEVLFIIINLLDDKIIFICINLNMPLFVYMAKYIYLMFYCVLL